MLKLFKKSILNVNKSNFLNIKEGNLIQNIKRFNFSGGSHHSESENEHSEHSDHSEHEAHHEPHNLIHEYNEEARSRIFQSKEEVFSVEKLLNNAKKPLAIPAKHYKDVQMFETEEQYIKFLAETFERKTLEKYPEYKVNLSKFIHKIPDYESMNVYQREVYTLDAYLYWKLETTEDDIRNSYDFKGTSLEQAKERFKFFESKKLFFISSINFI